MTFLTTLNPTYGLYAWLIVGIGFLLLEIATPGVFFFVSFAIGCFCAAPIAFFGFSLTTQCLTALVGLCTSFAIIRHFLARSTRSPSPQLKTNISALINKTGTVLLPISPYSPGRVKVNGETWSATTDEQHILHKSSLVTIIQIQGNKVVVRQILSQNLKGKK